MTVGEIVEYRRTQRGGYGFAVRYAAEVVGVTARRVRIRYRDTRGVEYVKCVPASSLMPARAPSARAKEE